MIISDEGRFMHRIIYIIFLLFGFVFAQVDRTIPIKNSKTDLLYNEAGLDSLLSREVFELSYLGYCRLLEAEQIFDSTKLTIIDFTKSSTEKRLFVIDINLRKILFSSHVAHGKNSGLHYAIHFSNKPGSLQSSLGFYITSQTYYGKHGYSLRLKGMESVYNSKAEDRAIVMHGANYVSEKLFRNMAGWDVAGAVLLCLTKYPR